MPELTVNFAEIIRFAGDAAQAATDETLAQILAQVRESVPVKTGSLRDSYQIDGNSVGSDSDYALPIEFGTARIAAHLNFTQAFAAAEKNYPETFQKKLAEKI